MKQLKNQFPFIGAIGVFFLASNQTIWKQMNQKPSVENEIKSIPVESFKQLIKTWVFSFSSLVGFDPTKIAVVFLRNGERSKQFHKPPCYNFFLLLLIVRREQECPTSNEYPLQRTDFLHCQHIDDIISKYHQLGRRQQVKTCPLFR